MLTRRNIHRGELHGVQHTTRRQGERSCSSAETRRVKNLMHYVSTPNSTTLQLGVRPRFEGDSEASGLEWQA